MAKAVSGQNATAPVLPWYSKMFGGVVNWRVRMMYVLYTMALEFPITAISLIIVREMDYTPEEVMRYYLLTYTPWMFKPVYALMSDQFPIFGYRRKPYILISGTFFLGLSRFSGVAFSEASILFCFVFFVSSLHVSSFHIFFTYFLSFFLFFSISFQLLCPVLYSFPCPLRRIISDFATLPS